ncbi:MAG: TonB family protein [Pseudomonadota bacterium]
MKPFALLAALLIAGCVSAPVPSPLSDPRERGPFRAQSDRPVPPNVERSADSSQCAGEPLRAIAAPLPDYPRRGWTRGLQGWAIVQFDVAQSGSVENVRVTRGVPGGSFNREADRAVRQWRFAELSEGARLTSCVVLFEFLMGDVYLR